jgi:hypothetical protein
MGQQTFRLGQFLTALCLCLSACGGGGGTIPATNADNVLMADASVVQALPTVSKGFKISVYASVPEPMKLSFAPDGTLYVGRQPGTRIHRIPPGGGTASEFGGDQSDPDAVLVDTIGKISGVPNSVLVGGDSILAAIFPNQVSSILFSSGFADVDDMKFDRNGRLIFSDDNPQVLSLTGNAQTGDSPQVLFTTPSRPGSIAINDNNQIFVALADGTIRIYNANGTPAGTFASGLAAGLDTYLDFGPGEGGFGQALYVLSGSNLLRINMQGNITTIGSGFSTGPSSGTGFVFGPDKALYVSDYTNNRVLKISR